MTTRDYHRGQHRSQGNIARCCRIWTVKASGRGGLLYMADFQPRPTAERIASAWLVRPEVMAISVTRQEDAR